MDAERTTSAPPRIHPTAVVDRTADLARHLAVDGVEPLRPVERDTRDAAVKKGYW